MYYDVHVSPGPVTGFIDAIDDDIEEAFERIADVENNIKAMHNGTQKNEESEDGPMIDLGDGWKGIAADDSIRDTRESSEEDDLLEEQLGRPMQIWMDDS